jgi:hypothetical protein
MCNVKRWILVVVLSVIIILIGGNSMQTDSLLEDAKDNDTLHENTFPPSKSIDQLVEQYRDLRLTDVHNHNASGRSYSRMQHTWERYAVSRVVLFGDVSESSAIRSDELAWAAYQDNPKLFIPYFSGFDLHDQSSLDVIRSNLEQGYFGVGEIAAASTYSPVLSQVEWKAEHPMDGYLPEIYELCAEYKVPILLHIDPPNGMPIVKLEEALTAHPHTVFIFAHMNAHNSPESMKQLMDKHPNLYADFFAGFTDLNPESANTLEDYVPIAEQYADRFLLSTDSGFGLSSEEEAIESMYRFIDLLDDHDIAQKIAHDNFDKIIQQQPATKTQLKAIAMLQDKDGNAYDTEHMTKLAAGEILAREK